MIEFVKKEQCVLCKACSNACAQGAIIFNDCFKGGRYPSIDPAKCISCGRCKKVCPLENDLETESLEKAVAVRTRDKTNLEQSSSGGLFFELAKNVLKDGGAVCGAVFDDRFAVKHIVTDDIVVIQKMRGSKYVQSDIGMSYHQIKKILGTGRTVLFSGCPCQVAGLQTFLGKKYENLILVDLICHGVPYENIWLDYLKIIEKKANSKIKVVNFRSKKNGWNPFSMETNFENGTTFVCSATEEPYMMGFLGNVYLKESCYACRFKNLSAGSDITIGDFWGVERFQQKKADNCGISLCICNTFKGERLINSLTDIVIKEEVEFIKATEKNPHLFRSAQRSDYSQTFYDLYNEGKQEEAFNLVKEKRGKVKKSNIFKRVGKKILRVMKICK